MAASLHCDVLTELSRPAVTASPIYTQVAALCIFAGFVVLLATTVAAGVLGFSLLRSWRGGAGAGTSGAGVFASAKLTQTYSNLAINKNMQGTVQEEIS